MASCQWGEKSDICKYFLNSTTPWCLSHLSYLDGYDRLQLLIFNFHRLGGSLSMRLTVGHHRSDYLTHTCYLKVNICFFFSRAPRSLISQMGKTPTCPSANTVSSCLIPVILLPGTESANRQQTTPGKRSAADVSTVLQHTLCNILCVFFHTPMYVHKKVCVIESCHTGVGFTGVLQRLHNVWGPYSIRPWALVLVIRAR